MTNRHDIMQNLIYVVNVLKRISEKRAIQSSQSKEISGQGNI